MGALALAIVVAVIVVTGMLVLHTCRHVAYRGFGSSGNGRPMLVSGSGSMVSGDTRGFAVNSDGCSGGGRSGG